MTEAVLPDACDDSSGTRAASWCAQDLAPTDRTLILTDGDIAELDRALHAVRRAELPLSSVTRADFPLPALGPKLSRLARDLDRLPGFHRVSRLPVGRYSAADLRLVYWGLGRHLGIPVPQDATGHLLRPADTSRTDFHSGGSDVVSLLALDGQRVVGLVSTGAIHNEVVRRRPDLALRMFDSFRVDGSGGQVPGGRTFRSMSLACWSEGRLSLRYDRRSIESAQWYAEAPRLSPADIDLFDLIDEVATSPGLRHDVHLEAGDLLLVNNYDVLHRHGSSSPAPDEGLLRLWLTLWQGRALPPTFTWPTPAYRATAGRGGVTPRDVIDPARSPSRELAGRR